MKINFDQRLEIITTFQVFQPAVTALFLFIFVFNPFVPHASFLYPMKTEGQRKGVLGTNGLSYSQSTNGITAEDTSNVKEERMRNWPTVCRIRCDISRVVGCRSCFLIVSCRETRIKKSYTGKHLQWCPLLKTRRLTL